MLLTTSLFHQWNIQVCCPEESCGEESYSEYSAKLDAIPTPLTIQNFALLTVCLQADEKSSTLKVCSEKIHPSIFLSNSKLTSKVLQGIAAGSFYFFVFYTPMCKQMLQLHLCIASSLSQEPVTTELLEFLDKFG